MKFLKFTSKNIRISDDEARRLTALFLDGGTEPDEDKLLYAYYSGKKIASDLIQYSKMFGWYHSLENPEADKKRRFGNVAVAAAIIAFVITGTGLFIGSSADMSAEQMYAGSYIIRNGKKITNISEILPELNRAERIVDSTMTAVNSMNADTIMAAMLEDAFGSISDPEIKAMIIAGIN